MKLTTTIFTLLFFLTTRHIAFAQKQEKVFYDKNWKVCSESKAEYYRLMTLDENRKSIGKVKDYYLNGQLQYEGEYSYVDKFENFRLSE